MPKHRIFIAVEIPEQLKDICEQHLRPFFNDENIRISQKAGWHITISFLGYLSDEEIGKLMEITKEAASQTKPFELRPDKIIFAPPERPKRMVWLDFRGSQEFEKLKSKIEDKLGFKKETRAAHIHLTLARFQPEHFPNVKKFLPQEGIDLKNSAKPFLVDKISIMESFLSRAGAEYKKVEEIKLK